MNTLPAQDPVAMAEPDTPDNNLILIGSETSNPWITLYKAAWTSIRVGIIARMSTVFQPRSASEQTRYDYVRTIRNVHTSTPSLAYTHLALLDNSQGSGKVLIVEGTSMGTTFAALTYCTQEQLWRPVMEAATDRSGQLHNFEVLLPASLFVAA